MKQMGRLVLRVAPWILCVALLASLIRGVSPTQWVAFGEGTAQLLMGLQNPRDSVAYWSDRLLAEETVATPTVPLASFTTSTTVVRTPIIPPKGEGGGTVIEEQIGGGAAITPTVSVKNNSGKDYDFAALLNAGMPFSVTPSKEPQVLIVHTHTTECYMEYYAGYYNADDETRTTDMSRSVAAVGEAIAQELRAAGIGVLHDTTLHDHPQYTGAYSRSEDTILSYLEQYPSIQLVLDIHRDAIMYDDLSKVKPTASVNGQKAAQVMLVVGGTDTADLPNAHCEENLRLGLQLQHSLETAYAGVTRPLYVVDARYNQGLLSGSLLIEVGTDANTLSEAIYSGHLIGKQLAQLIQ